jgi:hypothetical protein
LYFLYKLNEYSLVKEHGEVVGQDINWNVRKVDDHRNSK